ncbi:MAG: hypothetical protein WDW38_006323 [Sanguina aurantia]
MADVVIDSAVFSKRLKKFYQNWEEKGSSAWAGATAVYVVMGSSSEEIRYLKSLALHMWLFGYELPDTSMMFTKSELHVLTSKKKVSLLQPLAEECLSKCGIKLVLHPKPPKADKATPEDCTAQIGELMAVVRSDSDAPLLGILPKEQPEGHFAQQSGDLMRSSGLPTVDVAAGMADMFTQKDSTEILNARKAALLAGKVMTGFVVPKLESAVDEERKIKHSKLSTMAEECITDPSKVNVKLKADAVDLAYPPVFQSNGAYDLRVSAPNDNNLGHSGVILVSIGTRYSNYCANVARSFVINPTKRQEQQYNALLAAHEAAVAALLPGASMAAPMEAAIRALREKGQGDLVEKLGKGIGFGMGLEFREGANVLSAKNQGSVVLGNTVFNVCIGVQNLEDPDIADPALRKYALQIGDTYVVAGEGGKPPEWATSASPRTWDKISYLLQDDADNGDSDGSDFMDQGGGLQARKALRSETGVTKSQQQIIKEKQEALVKTKNEETLRRLTSQANGGAGSASSTGRKVSDIVAYRSVGDMPVSKDLIIQVDPRAETVLVPIYGNLVPFHITMIKAVTHNTDTDTAIVRVTFNTGPACEPSVRFPNAIFLKELSFRSADAKHAAKVVQDIKLLRSSVMQRDKERAERATLVTQDRLVKGKRVYKLPAASGPLFTQ